MEFRGMAAGLHPLKTGRLIAQVPLCIQAHLALSGNPQQQVAPGQDDMIMSQAGCRHRDQRVQRNILKGRHLF